MSFGDFFAMIPLPWYIIVPLLLLLLICAWYLGLWLVIAFFTEIFSWFSGKSAQKTTRGYDAEYYPKPSNEPKTNKGVLSTAARAITHNYAADQYKADQKRVERKNSPECGSKSIFGSSDNIFD